MVIVALSSLLLNGCTLIDHFVAHREKGPFWCNDPYLNKSKALPTPYSERINVISAEDPYLKISHRGYIYGLAAGLALQESKQEINSAKRTHYFMPRYDFLIPFKDNEHKLSHYKEKNGFEAKTYIYYPLNEQPRIIIAITGSQVGKDIWHDWIKTNFNKHPGQYISTLKYVKKVEKSAQQQGLNHPIDITGNSLGGALSTYAALHPYTKATIQQVWLFNPSARFNPNNKVKLNEIDGHMPHIQLEKTTSTDSRFFLLRTKHEIVDSLNLNFSSKEYNYLKEHIIPREQIFSEFAQVDANLIYSHYRWVLARTMLHYAALYQKLNANKREMLDGQNVTRPQYILNQSKFRACRMS